jgi:hypothetical protein
MPHMGEEIGLAQLVERSVKEIGYVTHGWRHTQHADVAAVTCADTFISNKKSLNMWCSCVFSSIKTKSKIMNNYLYNIIINT